MDAEQEREKPNKLSRSRHGRQWKGTVKDAVETLPLLRSLVISNTLVDEDAHMKVDNPKLSLSRPILQKKRHRPDERIQMKQDEVSKTIMNAPRRLLQFALRDALGSPRMNSLGSEPTSKRMRSLVSASAGDSSLGDRTQRIQSVSRVLNASMAVAIKAVAEAAKNVGEVRSSGNVFNRLGRSMDELDTSEHIAKFIGCPAEAVEENGSFDYLLEENQSAHLQLNDFDEHYSKNRISLESYAGVVSNNELYESGHIGGHNTIHSGISVQNRDDDSLMVQYNVAGKADQSTSKPRKKQYLSVAADTSSKMVNISVNVNTWKPSQYQETKKVSAVSCRKSVHESEAGDGKSNAQLMKENNGPFSVGNANAIPAAADSQRESQKSLSSTVGDDNDKKSVGSWKDGVNDALEINSLGNWKDGEEQSDNIRFPNVKIKNDFAYFEKVNKKYVNILDGLELHNGVFSEEEQKRIVDYVNNLEEKGKNGELKAYTAPKKWMIGKGRVTMQFGGGYNFVLDKKGNPPGILQDELVDKIPPLFKDIIRRLIRWHVLPATCVPDSCIVNIYDKGDCIPPHIDHHDFLRPFCTVSFLSECNIVFGSNPIIKGPGKFSGFSIPLPVGSVLVINGNGADLAKHCVPAVPTKRISITFRKMDESKWPVGFTLEPDLQGLRPLSY